MGEEEKKPEEKKPEEGKEEAKSEKPDEAKKEEKKAEDPKEAPPPPQEIVLRVYMHCEGCARKIKRSLKSVEGVEDVQTDCKTHKVIVKGEKADPRKVVERVEMKTHRRQVELLSPIPKPPPAEEAKKAEEKEAPKPQERKEEPPQVIILVLKVHMHCEACAQQLKRRIQRMQGVENADPDLKKSQVIVKGVFDPPKLVEYVYKRTGKQAVIVKVEPEKKEEEKPKEEKKGEDGKKGEEVKKDGGEKAAQPEAAAAVVEMKTSERLYNYYHPLNYHVYPPKLATEMYTSSYSYPPPHPPQMFGDYPPPHPPHMFGDYPPPHPPQMLGDYPPPHAPQMFSDENPNACSLM